MRDRLLSSLTLQKESFVAGKDPLIHAPSHYVEGRQIQPCEVMESWGLVQHHYIACAFKYLARAGRKGDPCLDLNKALWYLDRFEQIGGSLKNSVTKEAVTPEDLFLDWNYDLARGKTFSIKRLKNFIRLEQEGIERKKLL